MVPEAGGDSGDAPPPSRQQDARQGSGHAAAQKPALWQRLCRPLRTLGPLDGSLYLIAAALARITGGRCQLHRYYLVAQPVPEIAGDRAGSPQAIRRIDPADAVIGQFPRPPAVITERFATGGECLVAENGDRFAGYLWISRDSFDDPDQRCRFELLPASRCVWDYDVYIAPEFRLGRTFLRLWQGANAYLSSQGIGWSVSQISAFNRGSLAAHQRLGCIRKASSTFIVIGGMQLSIFTMPPYLHLSCSPHTQPTVRVDLSGTVPASPDGKP
ncbi:MAG: GNAT family N-acetyltransferase [Gammaproteobacteria bacterium]|nr:GNAT family N-acetyltransferase [Gammaproteobacteria bacterium]